MRKTPDKRSARCFLLFLSLAGAAWAGSGESVIEVNGQQVYRNVYDQEVKERQLLHEGKQASLSDELIQQSAISAIVNRVILLQEASKEGITVSEEELEAAYTRFKGRFERAGEFNDYLKQRSMSARDLRERIRESLTTEKFIERIKSTISVSDEEARKYYESQDPKTIGRRKYLIVIVKTSNAEIAKEIDRDIKRTYFNGVMKRLRSENNPEVELKGPIWVYPNEMNKEFLSVLKGLQKGTYAGPFQREGDWYFLGLNNVDTEILKFEEIEEKVKETLRDRKAGNIIESIINKRIAHSTIKIYYDKLK